ncbi:MAG TPA: hypothetical protein VFG35_30790 [Actinoplanes sp.]|nr:hypothetical protein [Actinoplanes sp.]
MVTTEGQPSIFPLAGGFFYRYRDNGTSFQRIWRGSGTKPEGKP